MTNESEVFEAFLQEGACRPLCTMLRASNAEIAAQAAGVAANICTTPERAAWLEEAGVVAPAVAGLQADDEGRAPFFFNISEHADGDRRGPVADLKVPKDASGRDLSNATLRLDLALGVRRRRAPKRLLKIDPRSGVKEAMAALVWNMAASSKKLQLSLSKQGTCMHA